MQGMATIIVNDNVWSRVDECYNNVEAKYPNTWDINDTTEQIEKIQQIIKNFESVSTWNREPMISSWKRMGWKETWDKNSNWHFAFDYNNTDGEDYIVIQDAEHQDNIKENKTYNKMKKTIKESQLRQIVKESIKKVLREADEENGEALNFYDFVDILKKNGWSYSGYQEVSNKQGQTGIRYRLYPERNASSADELIKQLQQAAVSPDGVIPSRWSNRYAPEQNGLSVVILN